jgi:hypothetical protein
LQAVVDAREAHRAAAVDIEVETRRAAAWIGS